MDRRSLSPQGQTAHILVEFLEVAVSCIVFLKVFYPAGAFERRRYMNVVVQKARHPQLGNYIHAATSELLPFIQKNTSRLRCTDMDTDTATWTRDTTCFENIGHRAFESLPLSTEYHIGLEFYVARLMQVLQAYLMDHHLKSTVTSSRLFLMVREALEVKDACYASSFAFAKAKENAPHLRLFSGSGCGYSTSDLLLRHIGWLHSYPNNEHDVAIENEDEEGDEEDYEVGDNADEDNEAFLTFADDDSEEE
ncbi:hypothetical protein M5K25_010842 [Dendrobium thyrsiflorum]|uniref:HORMA domain-containing protein n=1 Tax=Dendrobium thyrsiflorum TaxID=117978 RepID=A0ABD0V870_DENTH